MQSKKTFFVLPALVCIAGTGCGGGGGVSAIASRPVSTDVASAILPPNGSGVTALGCTSESYLPNYSKSIMLYRWNKFPLHVYFANSGVVIKDDGSRADLAPVALEGLNEWVNSTGGGIAYEVTADPALANMTVHFNTLSASPTVKDFLGVEQSSIFVDGTMKSADIQLSVWSGMSTENVAAFQETSAHEFGHALGLNGHSEDSRDVMFAVHLINTMKPLSDRDVNSMKTAYCNSFGRGVSKSASGPVTIVTNY